MAKFKRRPKKKKINPRLLWGGFIAVIMIFSTLGIMLGRNEGEQTFTYDGHTFVLENNRLSTIVEGEKLYFHYLPESIEKLNLTEEFKQGAELIKEVDSLMMTFDEGDEEIKSIASAIYYLEETLGNNPVKKIFVVKALTANNSYELPVISCANASASHPVIYLVSESEEKTILEIDGQCIIMRAGYSRDFLALKDGLLYAYLGILK